MALNPKERRFVSEFLKDQNATQAAIRAGFSEKNARTISSRLYAKVHIRAAIDRELAKIQEKAGVTQERILNALLNIAESDPRQLFKKDGTLKSVHDLSDAVASTVASIESDDKDGEVKKVKFWDKTRALELLGKHLKMFVERHESSGPDGGPIPVKSTPIDFSGLTTKELKRLVGTPDAAQGN